MNMATKQTGYGPGQFTGEVNMLSGRPAIHQIRVTKPGEVIVLERKHMLDLVKTDAELSEILMRAFILHRVELVSAGIGNVVLIGSTHSAGTLRIKEFLMRKAKVAREYKCSRETLYRYLRQGEKA